MEEQTKRKRGRPRKQIQVAAAKEQQPDPESNDLHVTKKVTLDVENLEKLCQFLPTQSEIAAFFGCGLSALQHILNRNPKFREAYERGLDKGRLRIRRNQMRAADNLNTGILIWLGKQHLGQRDQLEIETKSGSGLSPQERQQALLALINKAIDNKAKAEGVTIEGEYQEAENEKA